MLLFLFPGYLLSFCVANAKDSPTAKQMNETFTQQVSYARRKQQRLASKLHKMTVPEWSDRLRGSCWAHNVTFIITILPNHKHVITTWSQIVMLWSKRRRLMRISLLERHKIILCRRYPMVSNSHVSISSCCKHLYSKYCAVYIYIYIAFYNCEFCK